MNQLTELQTIIAGGDEKLSAQVIESLKAQVIGDEMQERLKAQIAADMNLWMKECQITGVDVDILRVNQETVFFSWKGKTWVVYLTATGRVKKRSSHLFEQD